MTYRLRFRVVAADPPWPFGDKLSGGTRGAARHYSTMSIEDLCRFGLPPLEENAWLFMWRVASMQEEALRVVRAWGFVPKSEIIWNKLTKDGKPWFGMGRYVRASHESCIVAVRGRVQPKVRNVRSRFAAPVPLGADGKPWHSAKPDAFFDLVEQLTDGPRAQLFSRQQRPGWSAFGDEVGVAWRKVA